MIDFTIIDNHNRDCKIEKTVGIVLFGIVGVLVLGIGMCMSMVWQGLMIQGIIIGIIGLVFLLCLIPLCKGIR